MDIPEFNKLLENIKIEYAVRDDKNKVVICEGYSDLFDYLPNPVFVPYYEVIFSNVDMLTVSINRVYNTDLIPEYVKEYQRSNDRHLQVTDSVQLEVRVFLQSLGVKLPDELVDIFPMDLCKKLVLEEAHEFADAVDDYKKFLLDDSNLPVDEYYELFLEKYAEIIDALCDTIVVVHNATNHMGIDIRPFFLEVMKTNFAKVGGPIREDGKLLKPEGWQPPQLKEILREMIGSRHLVVARRLKDV
jgi:NTP pyrophosphatase (non-canonical NTP hydrolase)